MSPEVRAGCRHQRTQQVTSTAAKQPRSPPCGEGRPWRSQPEQGVCASLLEPPPAQHLLWSPQVQAVALTSGPSPVATCEGAFWGHVTIPPHTSVSPFGKCGGYEPPPWASWESQGRMPGKCSVLQSAVAPVESRRQ